jgi:hypothetical protein
MFLIFIQNYLHIIWLVIVPMIVFSVRPRVKLKVRSGRLIFAAFLISAFSFFSLYAESLRYPYMDVFPTCLVPFTFSFAYTFFLSIIYVGWWEFIWRCVYKQWPMSIKKNLLENFTSTMFVFLSFVIPFIFLVIPQLCDACGDAMLTLIFKIRHFFNNLNYSHWCY